jgi:hypothetical protein
VCTTFCRKLPYFRVTGRRIYRPNVLTTSTYGVPSRNDRKWFERCTRTSTRVGVPPQNNQPQTSPERVSGLVRFKTHVDTKRLTTKRTNDERLPLRRIELEHRLSLSLYRCFRWTLSNLVAVLSFQLNHIKKNSSVKEKERKSKKTL